MKLTLLGTTTSPYVRKIRILLRGLKVESQLLDTRQPAGAAALTEHAPLGKIPVLIVEERGRLVLPDSTLIAAWLWDRFQPEIREAGLVLEAQNYEDRARQIVVEGALDAAINRFYLLRDGAANEGYVARQEQRVHTALDWLDGHMSFTTPAGSAALSLGCALDWMVFRSFVDLADYTGLQRFREDWLASEIGRGTEPG